MQAVPSTLSDLQAIVDNGAFTTTVSPTYDEVSSDEYFLPDDILNSFGENAFDFYVRKPYIAPPNSVNDWAMSYGAVYYANLVLDLIKDIKRTESNSTEWDNVKGNALFFRAYHFLNLLWVFAKAYDSTTANKDWGIALRQTSDFNVPSTRATVQQSYEQVINDTKASVSLLPKFPLVVTRASKGAAYGLLARCYLSIRDYKDALLYSDSSLQLNDNLIDLNGDNGISDNLMQDAPFQQYNKETILYVEMGYSYDIFTQIGFVDTSVFKLYDMNDLRSQAYYRNNGTGYYYFKAPYTGNIYINFTGIATDEMFLIRAECYTREGQVQKGLDDINTLLTKRYKKGTFTPLSNLSQNNALSIILQERRKEMLFRGNRWMDIKRLNKEGANIILKRIVEGQSYTLQPNSNFYALPLPDDIIKITGMPQNEE